MEYMESPTLEIRKHVSDAVDYQLANLDRADITQSAISRVLMIYTGGTIGMKHSANGYEPAPDFLTDTLATQTRFHDPYNVSVFGQSSRAASPLRANEESYYQVPSGLEPGARQSRGYPSNRIRRRNGELQDIRSLVTPASLYGKRIRYSILEYDPLLDSSNIGLQDWIDIATDIELNYKLYDAFIVIHGTDTMANTASALSFLLEDLGKTVIICGSQVPLSELRNDAVENLLGALTIAGHFVIPEVGLYFANRLFRGNRVTKMSAVDFDAFDSPNMRPLVNVGINIDVQWGEVLRPSNIATFKAHKRMHPNVTTLRLFPGILNSTIKAVFAPGMHVVLETFGAGNVPKSEELMAVLEDAYERGVVVVNCTQCKKGTVSDLYASGRQLAKYGVVPGGDMTAECALTKLSYLLSKYEDPTIIRSMMVKSLRGELTVIPQRTRFSQQQRAATMISNLVQSLSFTSPSGLSSYDRFVVERSLYPTLICTAAATGDRKGLTGLHERLMSSINELEPLSERGDDFVFLNCSDYNGFTPLHLAAKAGHVEIVKYLLEQGAHLHAKSNPTIHAVKDERDQITYNSEGKFHIRSGQTPLFMACMEGQVEVVRLLRSAGGYLSDVGSPSEMDDAWMYVAYACCGYGIQEGAKQKLQCWLLADWDLTCSGWDGRTVLHIAVGMSNSSAVRDILSSTSRKDQLIGCKDFWGFTVADEASRALAASSDRSRSDAEYVCQLLGVDSIS